MANRLSFPAMPDAKGFLSGTNRKQLLALGQELAAPILGEQTIRGAGWRRGDLIASSGMRYLGVYNPQKVSVATKKKMLLDPQVALMLAAAKAPCRTTTWTVETESPELKAIVETVLLREHARAMLAHHFHAVDFGYQVDELLIGRGTVPYSWEDEEGNQKDGAFTGFVLDELKDLDPSDFRFVADEMGRVVGITQATLVMDGAELVLMEKLAHLVNEAKWGDPHGTGRVERVYGPWYWETVLYLLCNQYFERRAVPSHVLFADPEDAPKDPDTGARSANALQSIALTYQRLVKSQSVVALWSKLHPDSKERLWDLRVLADEQRGEQFVTYIQHLDTKIARGLLMPERAATGNDASGSFSQTVALRGLGDLLGNAMLDDVARVWNGSRRDPGVLTRWAAWNGITDPIRVKHSGITPDAGELYANLVAKLLEAEQAILTGNSIEATEGLLVDMVDTARLLERLGVPTRDGVEQNRSVKAKGAGRGQADPDGADGNSPANQKRPPNGEGQAQGDADPNQKAAARYTLESLVEEETEVEAAEAAMFEDDDLLVVFEDFAEEVEAEVVAITAPQKEEVDLRERAAKAVLLALLLMSGKEDGKGGKVPGQGDVESLIWTTSGGRKVFKGAKKAAEALPTLQARAATLPGGGLRVAKGQKGLLAQALKAIQGLLGPNGLKAALENVGKGLKDGVNRMMKKAVDHFQRANKKGAWGSRSNWKAIINRGYPGRNPKAPPDAPNAVKWRKEAENAADVNWEGIRRNIENIGLRVLGGIVETMRNAFGTSRLLEAAAEALEPEEVGTWTTLALGFGPWTDEGDTLALGLVADVTDWSLNRRNTVLTLEAHLRGAYRAAMLQAAKLNGFHYLIGLHPKKGAAEEGPRGGAPSCRDLDGTVATIPWWTAQGEKAGQPTALEMFGLGWGCRILFFPYPMATIIRSKVDVKG